MVIIETVGTYRDYRYIVTFNTDMGHRCGYVGIPEGDELYKVEWLDNIINCHGDITFSDFSIILPDDYWYIGFDCCHLCDGIDLDAIEKYTGKNPLDDDNERFKILYTTRKDCYIMTMEDCIEECKGIIDQVIKYNERG